MPSWRLSWLTGAGGGMLVLQAAVLTYLSHPRPASLHGLNSKMKTRRQSRACSLDGSVYRCTQVAGFSLKGFNDPSPRLDCLTGKESWRICSNGEFLCLDPSSRLLSASQAKAANVTSNYCYLAGAWSMCRPLEYARSRYRDCLDSFFSHGICTPGETLCEWREMNVGETESLRSRMQVEEPSSRCLSQALPQGEVHVVVAMRDASPTMRVVEDVGLMGLTNSLVLLYRRADVGLNLAGMLSSPLVAGFPCGITVQEKLLAPNKGNEAAVYLAYMVEYYDKLPSMTVFLHDHGHTSWHSQLRPVFKRSRAFYLLVASRLRDRESGALVYPEIAKLAAYSSLVGFIDENPVTLNSCYCHELREPLCFVSYTVNDYERETNRSIHDTKSQAVLDKIYRAVISLRERSKPWDRRGRRLVWEEPPEVFQQSKRLFESIERRFGRTKSGPSIPFASCCAMFIAQSKHIRRQPKQFYNESLRAILSTPLLSYHTGRWFEFHWDDLFLDPSGARDPARRSLYVDIDDVYAEVYGETNRLADLQQLIDS
ncbi:hypothetical protein GUITHDRAFT_119900 [Guillardia theta CCMP2712]|uniref:Uncharacterized protein n=1 Tax=Guillardia theta (strain CCMP2712) TaxID=905079 RepID=L1ICW1_GUITC|nr:hypothetical protein GUITHDRAFT_119900 [Guillardia theta CCMP2712]EKX33917.1 hypothetical protein GUITHDRAFT_119900 [Guillardia theta CCMP2712]|eukprot:XP_005820897.1 hypothetical protein GUITHDRAFT_119900 [Guillardia theta CCMP2712]